jgi:hypothetical protein
MHQPTAAHSSPGDSAPGRLAAIAGVGFLAASLTGDLVIGNFPRPDTPAAKLAAYYLAHHGHVLAGGRLLALSGILAALFGTALWARIRRSSASHLVAGLVLVATALIALTTLASAGLYGLLGDIGGMRGISPAALQAWHILGSDGSLADAASTFLFVAAIGAAGLLGRALPRSLAWSAVVVAVLQLLPGPLGFFASLLFPLWVAIAGVVVWRSRAQATEPAARGSREDSREPAPSPAR